MMNLHQRLKWNYVYRNVEWGRLPLILFSSRLSFRGGDGGVFHP
jgi:hypothetical protein